jgi:PAS domain S-box-containing protein
LPVFLAAVAAAAAIFGVAGVVASRRMRPPRLAEGEAATRLAVTEQRLADLTELTSEWVWETDASLRFTYFSHDGRDHAGAKSRVLVGRRIAELVDQNEPSVRRHLADLAARVAFKNFQYRATDRQGNVCHVRVSGTPLFDADGTFLGYRGISSDATAEVEAERLAAEARGRLTDAIENISAGFLLCDADDRMVACNSRYRRWFFPGFEETLRPGMSFADILRHAQAVHPGLNEKNWGPQWQEKRLARRRDLGRPFEVRLHDGRILLAVERGTEGGGIVSTYTDITELKAHEREIASKSTALEATFDNMSEGITMIDRDLVVVGFNRRFVEMFSFPADSLKIGMPYEALLRVHTEVGNFGPGDADEQVRARLERAKRGGRQVYVIELPDGRIVQMRRKPMPDGGFINTYTDVTDIKRHERELAEKSATLTATFDNMSEGVTMIGADLNLVSYNARFATMFNFPPGFLKVGMAYEALLRFNAESGIYGNVDVEADVRRRIERARRGDALIAEVEPRPGQIVQLRRTMLPGGAFINTYTDITDTKRRERELAGKSALFEAVLDNMGEGVAMIDRELNLLAFNQRYVDLLNLPRDRMRPGIGIGEVYRFIAEHGDFGPGDIEAQVEERIARTLRFEPYTVERTRGDGMTLEIRSNPIPGGGAVITLSDITKRKRAEQALRASEERYALAQRGSNEGLWDWDIKLDKIYVSPRVKPILDLTDADVASFKRGWFDYVHPEDIARYRAAIIAHLKGQTDHYSCEYRVRTAEGAYRWVRDRGLALREADGRAYRMAGSVGDITAEVEAVQALRHAKDVAETASRTKSEFLANMSHELRTPLNAIIGFAEMMKLEVFGSLGNDHYREYIADIHHSGQHLLKLINDILDVSKVEAGKIELHESEIDVAEVVAACIRLVNERAATGAVTILVDLPRDLPALYADEHRVKQILLNLLSNAVKFTPPKGTVTVRARADRMQGFAVEVVDTGIGIAAKDVPRAFEPFVQIDSALNRKAEGTGLGLPLSRALMALHGGSLDLISEPGKGTNVRVAFPVVRIIQRRRAS